MKKDKKPGWRAFWENDTGHGLLFVRADTKEEARQLTLKLRPQATNISYLEPQEGWP